MTSPTNEPAEWRNYLKAEERETLERAERELELLSVPLRALKAKLKARCIKRLKRSREDAPND